MVSVHSYEQNSITIIPFESSGVNNGNWDGSRGASTTNYSAKKNDLDNHLNNTNLNEKQDQNRIIIVDRLQPDATWSATNFPVKSIRTIAFDWLCGWFNKDSNEIHNYKNKNGDQTEINQKLSKSTSSSKNIKKKKFDYGPFNSNELLTSKYTLLNFLPKNLFEQFRRLANFYFLTTALLQIFLPFSPIGPTTSLLPLIFVISTTAIKQAYEDYLRHKLDKEINNRICRVLRNKKIIKIKSKDIKVGDFVYVKNNEEIPCDMMLLAASSGMTTWSNKTGSPSALTLPAITTNTNTKTAIISSANSSISSGQISGDRCYITTVNLDGETNLKPRSCVNIKDQLGGISELDKQLLVVECDKPNATLYEFNGFLRAPKSREAYDELVSDLNGSRIVLTSSPHQANNDNNDKDENKSRRSSWSSSISSRTTVIKTLLNRIKRTRFLPASIIGRQRTDPQSQSQYSKEKRNKSSSSSSTSRKIKSQSELILRKMANEYHEIPLDISNLLLRASRLRNTSYIYGLAIYTGSDTKLAKNSQVKPNKFSSTESKVNSYLAIAFFILILFSTLGTIFSQSSKRKEMNFEEAFIAHFLLYNYMIPISLYVTLEFIKFFGTMSVVDDEQMKTPVWVNERSMLSSDFENHPDNNQLRNNNNTIDNFNPLPSSNQIMINGNSIQSIPSTRKIKLLEKPKCNSSDLNEELGQVQVLFTDKTGTLTENEMRFTACSAYGSLYRFVHDKLFLELEEQTSKRFAKNQCQDIVKKLSRIKTNRYAHIQYSDRKQESKSCNFKSAGKQPSTTTTTTSTKKTLDFNLSAFDHRKVPPLNSMRLIHDMDNHERVAEFFVCLCLCSTINLNENLPLENCLPDKVKTEYDFKSASPDEESLIKAAQLSGITMCKSNERECFIVIERSRQSRRIRSANIRMDKINPEQSPKNNEPKSLDSHESPNRSLQGGSNNLNNKFKAIVETKNSTERYIVRHFERLVLLEFNSTRKRMSVIYKDHDTNCILMVSKGSEDLLDCVRLDEDFELSERLCINVTLAHFEAFARSGLRSMLVARRVLSQTEQEKIVNNMKDARASLQDREKKLNDIYRASEVDMKLIGATAVEDTLQEKVPETIENLKMAGIKVWLLTGDKVETAISVAYLSKLLDNRTSLFHLVRVQDSNVCRKLLSKFKQQVVSYQRKQRGARFDNDDDDLNGNSSDVKFALIIDGRSLYYAMKYHRDEFALLCKHCQIVLGCRLSPLQKAEVVDMMKNDEDKPITAAIGDGANDVSMIQEAHVGIGVRGKEGRQATNCADFAINRFYLLNRLFFIHGHLFYHRTAITIHYFFYKNFLFVMPQFIYTFYNYTRVLSLYHPLLLICYNLFFTSMPILLFGLHETNIPEQILVKYPSLYRINRNNYLMRMPLFISWLLLGAIQGLIIFYAVYSVLEEPLKSISRTSHEQVMLLNIVTSNITIAQVSPAPTVQDSTGNTSLGVKVYLVVVLIATIRLYFEARTFNWSFIFSTVVSCALVPILLFPYSLISWDLIIEDKSLYGQIGPLFKSHMFWIAVLTTMLAAIVPDLIWFIKRRLDYNRTINWYIKSTGGDIPNKLSFKTQQHIKSFKSYIDSNGRKSNSSSSSSSSDRNQSKKVEIYKHKQNLINNKGLKGGGSGG